MSTWSTCLLLYCLRSSRVIKWAVILFPAYSLISLSISHVDSPPFRPFHQAASVITRENGRFMLAYHFCMVSNSGCRRSWFPDIVGTLMGYTGFPRRRERDPGRPWPESTGWLLARWILSTLMPKCRTTDLYRIKADKDNVQIKATTREYVNEIIPIMGTYEY